MYARAMTAPPPRGPRLRELGLRIGRFDTGPANAITDVAGVAVGHVTIWRDEPEPPDGRGVARTGVTAVLPAPVDSIFAQPVPAGVAVLNGAGELTGSRQIAEWGHLETPVYLTSTHAVGRVFDGAVSVAVADGRARGRPRSSSRSWASATTAGSPMRTPCTSRPTTSPSAVASAAAGPVVEGAAGAGTGMLTKGFKAGIGTASRIVPGIGGAVGVLVLSNFYSPPGLVMDGVPVGDLLGAADGGRRAPAGSAIVVVAVDAALSTHQLERVARRAGLGLARCGSVAHSGSGEIFVAFAPPGRRPRGEAPLATVPDPSLERRLRGRRRRDRGSRAQRALGSSRGDRPAGTRRARAAARRRARPACRAWAPRVTEVSRRPSRGRRARP